MKLCPLAMVFANIPSSQLSLERKHSYIEDLTRMTHSTPSAVISAILFCEMVRFLRCSSSLETGCLFEDKPFRRDHLLPR